MRLTEAFDMYFNEYMAIKGQSRRIVESHIYCRRKIIELLGDKDVSKLTVEDVSKWVKEMRKTRCLNTVRTYITRLRCVLAYCELRGIPCLNPALIPMPKRDETVPVFLSEAEVTAMIACAYNLRNAFVISLLYSSGIRLSELIQLNRGQIVDRRFTVIGKGRKSRLCFIDKRTDDLMSAYLATREDKSPALIVSARYKQRMTPTNIQLLVHNSAVRAGIKKNVTPHTLRHSFATNFLRNNGNMRYLSTMLGHASLDTTMMYTHVVDYDLQRQYEKYHSI